MWSLKAGDSMQIKGPFVKLAYEPNKWSSVGMVAGGTGIAPMYQLILEMLANPRDRTEIRLIYASRTEADIILKTELDALAIVYPNFKVRHNVTIPFTDSTTLTHITATPLLAPAQVQYVLSKPGEGWGGATGHIKKESITSFLPSPQEGPSTKIFVCGPPGFMNTLSGSKKSPTDQGELTGLLKDLKYSSEQVFKF